MLEAGKGCNRCVPVLQIAEVIVAREPLRCVDLLEMEAGRLIVCEDDLGRVLGWPDGDSRKEVDVRSD